MKLIFKILALPVLFVVKVICVLGNLRTKDLAEQADLSNYTINKMHRGENVTTDTLVKICSTMGCAFDDIMEIVPDK